MQEREELIDFIVSSAESIEDISMEERLNLVEKLNSMSHEELEKEADWYEELLMK